MLSLTKELDSLQSKNFPPKAKKQKECQSNFCYIAINKGMPPDVVGWRYVSDQTASCRQALRF